MVATVRAAVDHVKLISDKFDSYESVRCFVDNYPELSA